MKWYMWMATGALLWHLLWHFHSAVWGWVKSAWCWLWEKVTG